MNEASGMTPRVKAAIEKIKSNCKDGQFISAEDLRNKYGISVTTLVKYGIARNWFETVDEDADINEVVDLANSYIFENGSPYETTGTYVVKNGKIYWGRDVEGVKLTLK